MLVTCHSYAFSSLTLLHPHNFPPAAISFPKAWWCNIEGDVNTFFCPPREGGKMEEVLKYKTPGGKMSLQD